MDTILRRKESAGQVKQEDQWTRRERKRDCGPVKAKVARWGEGGRAPSVLEGEREKQGPVEERQQERAKEAESQVDTGEEKKREARSQ